MSCAKLWIAILKSLPALLLLLAAPSLSAAEVHKFDMGPPESAGERGYKLVAKDTVYSKEAGFGWKRPADTDFDRRGETIPHYGQAWTVEQYTGPATHLTFDGVADKGTLIFRIDLPNGRYYVNAILGDLMTSSYEMGVAANGATIARHLKAVTYYGRGWDGSPVGGVWRQRFVADVTKGFLEISFFGTKPAGPPRQYMPPGSDWRLDHGLNYAPPSGYRAVPETFTRNTVLGLEVYPYPEPPLTGEGDSLTLSGSIGDAKAIKAVNAFNAGRFDEALEAFNGTSAPRVKAAGLMWLAGRPEREDDYALVNAAREIMESYAASNPDDGYAAQLLSQAETAAFALKLFNREVVPPLKGINHALWVAEAIFRNFAPDEPFYYRARLNFARLNCGADPNGVTDASERGYLAMFDLKKKFPDNPIIQAYTMHIPSVDKRKSVLRFTSVNTFEEAEALREKNRAGPQPSRRYDWGYEGAPDWASALRDASGWILDMLEWWVDNRQQPDGAMGGGWSDDVEMLRVWGPLALSGVSAKVRESALRLANGAWNSPGMNREWGLQDAVADAEHITEMTSDTVPLLVTLDYGNREYIERCIIASQKVRDFFTGINPEGHRLAKAIHFGPDHIDPEPSQANDVPYHQRLGRTAASLMWYNRNPSAIKFMSEWADSWVDAAYRTDKGKPRGVLPSAIGFPNGELGGVGSKTWYKGKKLSWHSNLIYNLFIAAYQATGERKYIQPIYDAYEFVTANLPKEGEEEPPLGSDAWAAKWLSGSLPGSLVRLKLITGEAPGEDFVFRQAGGKGVFLGRLVAGGRGEFDRFVIDGNKIHIYDGAQHVNHVVTNYGLIMATTEVRQTDRGGFPFAVHAYPAHPYIYGYSVAGYPDFAVAWEGIDRHVVALVLSADNSHLRALLYNFHPERREVGAHLFRLDVRGGYSVTLGPDNDGDDKADSVAWQTDFVHEHRGDTLRFPLPPKSAQVLEITKTGESGQPFIDAPDLALTSKDIEFDSATQISVTVHNIGNQTARNATVAVYEGTQAAGEPIGTAVLNQLEAPNDLVVKTRTLTIALSSPIARRGITVKLDPEDEIYEITERNNSVTVRPPRGRGR